MNKVTRQELLALQYCIDAARDWRGSMTGNPDPQPLITFDNTIKQARSAIAKIKQSQRRRRPATSKKVGTKIAK